MAQYDGSIRINTSIDVKGIEKGYKEMASALNDVAHGMNDIVTGANKASDAVSSFAKKESESIKEVEENLSDVSKNIDNLNDKKIDIKIERHDDIPISEDIEELRTVQVSSESLKYNEDAIRFIEEYAEKTKDITKEETEEEKRLSQIRENAVVSSQRIVELAERRKLLAQEIKELEKAGVTQGYIDYESRVQELEGIDKALKDYSDNIKNVKVSYKNLGDVARNTISLLKRGLTDIPIAAAKNGVGGLKAAFSGLGSVAKKSLSFMGSKLKNMTTSMLGFGKSAKKSSGFLSTIGSRFKGLALSLLIFNQVSKAFNAMISGIKEGFSNLYNENMNFKSSVDSLQGSLLTLKNALAGAFSPIVQIAIPYIQQLIGWITSAVEAVGQFIAALTGRKTYTKAIKQSAAASNNAAKATQKEADAMKDAEEAAEGYLSPLDEINKYNEDKDKNKGSSAGGGAGAGAGAGVGQMFEEVPISNKFKDIAQWFKDMWKNADFTELGTLLGKKLKSALDSIPWDSIQQTAAKVGKSFATLINGFVEVPKLGYTIGKSIGEAINTGIELSNNFFDNMHWDSLGKFFGEGFNGIIESIKWKDLGHNLVARFRAIVITAINFLGSINFGSISNGLSEFAIGIFDSLSDLIAEIEWSKLPRWIIDSISDFFKGFDYKGVFGSIGKLVATVVVAGIDLISALGEILADIGTKVKDFFVKKFKEAGWSEDGGFIENGKAIIDGLLNGILEGIAGIGEWIYKNIFKQFIDGFKDAFGIHSPSTVMAEMGKYLIQGLLDGIEGLAGNVKRAWDSMKQTAIQTWETVKQNIGSKWEQIKTNSKTTFSTISSNTRTSWDSIKTNVKSAADTARNNIVTAWKTAGDNTRTSWENMKTNAVTAAKSIASDVKAKYSEIKDAVRSFSSSAPSLWRSAWDSMGNRVTSVLNSIKRTVSNVFSWISNSIKNLGNSLKNLASKASSSSSSKKSSARSSNARSIFSSSPYAMYPELTSMDIPKLATGAVIPANKEFLAVLGDQKHGTNVEAPLDTIKQAQKEALIETLSGLGLTANAGNNKGNTYNIKALARSKVLFELMIEEGKIQQMSTGKNPFALGGI